jgi:hypothetical protein
MENVSQLQGQDLLFFLESGQSYKSDNLTFWRLNVF